ncbi:unnamed protein product [Closterium sp. Naga37s-1]|nr:unnamed protein product [Closterium sp. Naga37s-1]
MAGHVPPCALPAATARSPPSMCSACGRATVGLACTTHCCCTSRYHLPQASDATSLTDNTSISLDQMPPPIGGFAISSALAPFHWRHCHSLFPLAADWLDPLTATATCPSATGWELNAKGRTGARCADLALLMDPARLADEAASLNLKLMRWRVLPQLQAWGIRDITLVDYGAFSYSNPVRQCLFSVKHCLNGGMPKAQAAADALKEILPTAADVAALLALIRQSDAVFLLTDTRESRWLPTLLCAAEGKVAINAALGFDSFLVMRHGAPPLPLHATSAPASSESAPAASESVPAASESAPSKRLGCYFCNDVVAPLNGSCPPLVSFALLPLYINLSAISSAPHLTLPQPLALLLPVPIFPSTTAITSLPIPVFPSPPVHGSSHARAAVHSHPPWPGNHSGRSGSGIIGGAAAPPAWEQVVTWQAATAGALAVELLVGLLHHPLGPPVSPSLLKSPNQLKDTSADGISSSSSAASSTSTSAHLSSPLSAHCPTSCVASSPPSPTFPSEC